MSTLPDYTTYQLVESEMITKRLDIPLYNITKGITSLAPKSPEIQLYLLTRNLYPMGEARLEVQSSREVTLEPESINTKQLQEQQQEEEYEYIVSEEEDLEVVRVEAEKQKYIFQQPPTGPPPALKRSLDKGKLPQFQAHTRKLGDGNHTSTKDKSQKQTQKKNQSQDSHSIGKSSSRTEGSKKAGRSKRPSDDDPDDDPDSEGSDAGRDADRSGSDNESDQETAAEESDRSVSEITPSMAEWEEITGQKQRSTSGKTKKPNKLAKIRDPGNCDGKADKWRDAITFDQYGQLIIKWLKWQEYDIQSEDALERASVLMTGSAGV